MPAEAPSPDEVRSPVDDRTYNLLQALTSTLEAIDAYELYASEDGQAALFEGLLVDERRHAEILVDELRMSLESLAATRGGNGSMSASTAELGSSAAG
jgi:hypothetical protein